MRLPLRRFATCALLLLALWLLARTYGGRGDAPSPQTAETRRPPNVVIVVLDTTRGDRCSVNGYARPTTPELEALAREGAVFRDCWSPSPWTAPAHASLFTGLRPRNHGLMAGNGYYLSDALDTLAERLARNGWSTACFTANDFISPSFGLTQGFGFVERVYDLPMSAYPFAAGAHDRGVDWALREHAQGRRFFLFLNDIEPHAPYTPPAESEAQFIGDATPQEVAAARALEFPITLGYNVGAIHIPPRIIEVASRLYDAEVATVDAAVGRLVRRLRDAGVLDDTVLVVLGDHGENFGEHGLLEHVFSMHRTLLHVPLVVRYPPAFAAGCVVDDLVRLEDVHTTIVGLCGLTPEPRRDGASLVGDVAGRIAIGDSGIPELALAIVRERFPEADLTRLATDTRSVYDGRHHLIRTSAGHTELYDVKADPLEEHDLSGEQPELVARLRTLLAR